MSLSCFPHLLACIHVARARPTCLTAREALTCSLEFESTTRNRARFSGLLLPAHFTSPTRQHAPATGTPGQHAPKRVDWTTGRRRSLRRQERALTRLDSELRARGLTTERSRRARRTLHIEALHAGTGTDADGAPWRLLRKAEPDELGGCLAALLECDSCSRRELGLVWTDHDADEYISEQRAVDAAIDRYPAAA
jgi:hypothetical protein